MRAIKYRELKRMYEAAGPKDTCRRLREAIQAKELSPEDFSIKELAEATLGEGRVRDMDPRRGGGLVLEGDAVDSTAFSNITGQLLISKIMESYQNEAFVLSGVVPNIPTRLSGELIPGMGKLRGTKADGTDAEGLDSDGVKEGMPYPAMGFGEDYVETPQTTKRGFIVPVTKEAIFFDRTNLILQRAAEVGEVLGLNKEKRLLDVLIGQTNNHKWKGTTYDTYSVDGLVGAAGGTALPGDAENAASSSHLGVINQFTDVLTDWTDIDVAEQLFANILDPNTGEPVLITANMLLIPPALRKIGERILNATEVRTATGSSAYTTITGNPVNGYQMSISRLLYRRLISTGIAETAAAAAKFWFLGDFRKAFAYMENWPITVVQAPANSEAEFNQDIIVRFKASERGAAAVMNPRYVVRSTGAGS